MFGPGLTLKIHLAAISASHIHFDDSIVGAHTLACHFMKRALIERLFEPLHQCFILGSISGAGGKGSSFWSVQAKVTLMWWHSCSLFHWLKCERATNTTIICHLSFVSEVATDYCFGDLYSSLCHTWRTGEALCSVTSIERELSPSANVICALLFKPETGETRPHSFYVRRNCNGSQPYGQGPPT